MTGADSPVSMASERIACPLNSSPSHGSTMLGTRRITSPGCSDDVHTRSYWGEDKRGGERGTYSAREHYVLLFEAL